jgi:hypothetical protein
VNRLLAAPLLLLTLLACEKSPASTSTAPATSASTSTSTSTSNSTSPSTSASPATEAPQTFTGTYTAKEGTLFVPDGGEWSGVKWRGDDAGIGLGDGTLLLKIEPKTGRAEGTADGALGGLVLSGSQDQGILGFTLAPKDVADRGFSGTAQGKVAGEAIEGTMNLSLAGGNVIRTATFTLKKK